MNTDETTKTNPFQEVLPELEALNDLIWEELTKSASQPSEPWGLGLFGSIQETKEPSSPDVRMLALRNVIIASRSLLWHTDLRSSKVEQLRLNGNSSVLFWSPKLRVQLVVTGTTQVYESGKLVDDEWDASQLTSRRAYLGDRSPGDEVSEMCVNFPDQFTNRPPTESESACGKSHFAVLKTVVSNMDLLILRQVGNVRAKFSWNEKSNRWNGTWVCP